LFLSLRNRRASASFTPSPSRRNSKSVSVPLPASAKTLILRAFLHTDVFLLPPCPKWDMLVQSPPRYMTFYADSVSAFDIVMRVVTV
jgi:hypothetical protein